MPLVSGTVHYEKTARSFRSARGELPYVAATFLTRLAAAARRGVQDAIPAQFDRPTPFTVRRVSSTRASRSSLAAMVLIPDSPDQSGRSTSEYMRPGVYGSSGRHQKKSEYLLSRMGYLPPGEVMIPGSFLKGRLDGYGNVPGSYYKQIIRDLQIKNTKGPPKPRFRVSTRRAARMGVASEFFVAVRGNRLARGGGWLPPGVYRRTGPRGERLQQYFLFVPRARYSKRLDMRETVADTIRTEGAAIWSGAFASVRAKFSARGRR